MDGVVRTLGVCGNSASCEVWGDGRVMGGTNSRVIAGMGFCWGVESVRALTLPARRPCHDRSSTVHERPSFGIRAKLPRRGRKVRHARVRPQPRHQDHLVVSLPKSNVSE